MTEETPRRVLLVDDEVPVATAIADLLLSFGLHVDVVHLAAHVIPAIEAFDPEVIILDVRLPDGDGRDVFHAVRERWPEMPVVFSSAHVSHISEVGNHADQDGRVRLLHKPYESDALLEAIDSVCRA